jgi:CheY-like chemotaxis protein
MEIEESSDHLNRTDLSGLKVLVVDDHPAAAQTLAWALELLGLEAKTCSTGERALEIVAEFNPEIVLLDIGLPGMNGYEVCRRLRSNARTRSAIS